MPVCNCSHRLRGSIERFFRPHLIGGDDFVIERLHLLHEARLIKRPAVRHDRHRLRHLQWRDQEVALADRKIRDVAVEQSFGRASLSCIDR